MVHGGGGHLIIAFAPGVLISYESNPHHLPVGWYLGYMYQSTYMCCTSASIDARQVFLNWSNVPSDFSLFKTESALGKAPNCSITGARDRH